MPHRSLTWLLIFLLLALSVVYAFEINKDKESFLYKDYGKFYIATQFFFQHKSIYTQTFTATKQADKTVTSQAGALLNPPFFTLVMLPLGLFSYAASLWIWSLISLACGVLSILLLQKIIALNQHSLNYTLALLLAFFAYYPTFTNMQFGQMTLLLMPLTMGAWLAAREKNVLTLGLLLGIAASLKPFFGLFIFYFALRREWRALFYFVMTIIVCAVLALALFGLKSYPAYYHTLQSVYWYASSWNISLYGWLLRLFGGAEHNVPVLAFPWLSQKLFWLLVILTLSLFGKFLLAKNIPNDKHKIDLDFSITVITMLLLSPLTWIYYFPLLLIPVVTLWQLAKQFRLTGLYLLTCLSVVLSSISHLFIEPDKITHENVISVFTLSSCNTAALVLLFFALYKVQRHLARPALSMGTLVLSQLEWLGFYVIILLPSLFSVLNVINLSTLFGVNHVPGFSFSHFGT